jgi:DNA-binding CsgD family transcriptional regulator
MRVLSATGALLERDFPYGLVRQLLEGQVHGAPEARREALLRGAAAFAEPVFSAAVDAGGATDVSHARLHGLYWLVANLGEDQPLLLVADDVHWADPPSLRFLAFLAQRVEDLPVVLAVGTRPGEPGAEQDLIDALAAGPATLVVRPGSLSGPAVGILVERALGTRADPAFVAACAEVTAGNPLLLRELCRKLAADGRSGTADEAAHVREAVPETIGRSVVARLRQLSPAALALARSLAVLGDRARREHVVALAQVPRQTADTAYEALVRAGLVDGAEQRFIHPMVREAVYADLIGARRSSWHRRAAELLHQAGAAGDQVALHLLSSDPAGESWAADALAGAGRGALADGAPDVAVRLLGRAVDETPEAPTPQLLLDLGIAKARTADPDALAALERAAAAGDAVVAARAAQVRSSVLIMLGRGPEAPGVLQAAVEAVRPVDAEVAAELEDELLDTLPYDDAHVRQYRSLIRDTGRRARPTPLAHLAWELASTGAPTEEVIAVSERALAGGGLVAMIGVERFTPFYVVAALEVVDAADLAAQALHATELAARRSGSGIAIAATTWIRCQWERRFGDLRRAEEEARRGLAMLEAGRHAGGLVMSHVSLASALVDQGRIEEAEAVADRLPVRETMAFRSLGLHATRGRIRYEAGRHLEALADLDEHACIEDMRGRVVELREPRVLRALVLGALGRTDEARAIADREVDLALRRGVAGAEGTARLARARLLEGDAALAELSLAVAAARRSPSPQLLARALLDHGAALRRANQRAAAREPLREARDVAHRCGASGVAERAHEELVVAGGRPQRVALAGVDALTAAEKRVAELAAEGLRNRDIAETLFVTLKTVEVHLGHVYAKLGIQGRSQLPAALGR